MTAKMIDKLALITLKDGKVAMVRSHNKTLFYAPGGKREAGETDEQALCREIAELDWLDSRDLPRCSLVAALIVKDLAARKLIG